MKIKIQMDFNVIDSVINAVFFAQEKTVSGVVSDSFTWFKCINQRQYKRYTDRLEGRYSIKAKTGDVYSAL
jgi:hypothetical protein